MSTNGSSTNGLSSNILSGKVGLIVGVANAWSYAFHIAKSLTAHGATCGYAHLPGERNAHRVNRALAELNLPTQPWMHPMDAGKDEDIAACFDAYGKQFGKMDFLIHSIAFAQTEFLKEGNFINTSREAYVQAMDISAYTLVAFARHAAPLMKDGGSILSMSYYGSQKVIPGYNVMGVAKAALECSTRYLAAGLGEQKIRVNAISGGYLRTLASSAVGGVDKLGDEIARRAPLRRGVDGQDVGETAAFLVSDMARGITGEVLYVDCGVNILGA